MKRPAAFLDRDGTIIRNVPYLGTPDGIEVLPNAVRGIRALQKAGFVPVIVSNQSGVARGLITLEDLGRVNRRLDDLLRKRGVRLAGIYCCPHHPEGTVRRFARACACRKPRPGLLRRAARELRLDLGRSVFLGDSESDVEAGRAAGVRTIRVGVDAADLLDAARRIAAATRTASARTSPTTRPRRAARPRSRRRPC